MKKKPPVIIFSFLFVSLSLSSQARVAADQHDTFWPENNYVISVNTLSAHELKASTSALGMLKSQQSTSNYCSFNCYTGAGSALVWTESTHSGPSSNSSSNGSFTFLSQLKPISALSADKTQTVDRYQLSPAVYLSGHAYSPERYGHHNHALTAVSDQRGGFLAASHESVVGAYSAVNNSLAPHENLSTDVQMVDEEARTLNVHSVGHDALMIEDISRTAQPEETSWRFEPRQQQSFLLPEAFSLVLLGLGLVGLGFSRKRLSR